MGQDYHKLQWDGDQHKVKLTQVQWGWWKDDSKTRVEYWKWNLEDGDKNKVELRIRKNASDLIRVRVRGVRMTDTDLLGPHLTHGSTAGRLNKVKKEEQLHQYLSSYLVTHPLSLMAFTNYDYCMLLLSKWETADRLSYVGLSLKTVYCTCAV